MAFKKLHIKEEDKILIVAPHPDDECIGMGGVLALFHNQCDIVVVTDGCHGDKNTIPPIEKKIRRKQLEKEMSIVKPSRFWTLDYTDGELTGRIDCFDTIHFEEYTKVFLPFVGDIHPDHVATFEYGITAISKLPQNICPAVYQYEVNAPMNYFTEYLDISDVIEQKLSFIRCHEDQIAVRCYDEIAKYQAKYRACFCNNPDGYYECYLKTDPYI